MSAPTTGGPGEPLDQRSPHPPPPLPCDVVAPGRAAPGWLPLVLGAVLGLVVLAGTVGAVLVVSGPTAKPAPKLPDPTPRASRPQAAKTVVDLGAAPRLSVALPRIEHFVEQARGHWFRDHVRVTPLGRGAFLAQLHRAEGSDSPGASATDATLTALRLISPGLDYGTATRDSLDAAVGGFYDERTKRLYVRGRRLTPLAQVIVAHELTHALDDQWFDIRRMRRRITNGDQALAVQSLLEGDARWVEDRFRAALTPRRRAQARAESKRIYGGPTGDVPDTLVTVEAFPYEVGEHFVDELRRHGGSRGVDRAFSRPPRTTLQVMDPREVFVDRRDDGVSVPTPPYEGERVDQDRLGAFGLALMLAGGHPQRLFANPAPAYWEGDSYVTYRAAGLLCLRDRLQVDLARHLPGVLGALRAWAAKHPGSTVTAERGDRLLLTTCTAG